MRQSHARYDVSRVAAQEVPYVRDRKIEPGFERLRCDAGAVRGEHYVFELRERMPRRHRLDIEDVQASAGNAAAGERFDERGFIDDGPASRVDQNGRGLHFVYLGFAQEAARVIGEAQ